MSDAHQFRTGDHPTPFSADEIRAGCPPGRTVRALVVRAGAEPHVRVTRFASCDAEGADGEYWTESPDGVRLSEREQERSTWREFQGHASMPAATTDIAEETIDIPAGRFDCLRYTRRDDDGTVSTFWFARSVPGMPMKFEVRAGGELVFSSTAIEDVRP